jgi:N-methylhydantoinase B
MVRRIRLLGEEAQYSVLSDRGVIPPWGVLGAGSGLPYHLSIERGGSTFEFATPGKVTGHPLRRDDIVVMRSSGGGGYGDPLQRDPERVAADVEHGSVSAAAARQWHGVVLDTTGSVDQDATHTLRVELAAARVTLAVVADDSVDPYVGAKGRHRTIELAPADASKLGVADDALVELFGRHPAPLRAWVRIGTGRSVAGVIRLDAFGRMVLGVSNGERVIARGLSTPAVAAGIAGSARKADA